MYKFSIKILLGAFVFITITFSAVAQPKHKRILGGGYLDLVPTAVAYIDLGSGSCTGVLVGPKEVLTAAHCVALDSPVIPYIYVGGEIFQGVDAYYNSNYISGSDPAVSGPYDLGIYILDRPSQTRPIPVLYNDSVSSGEVAAIYGFGRNEISGLQSNYWEKGKGGDVIITNASNGIIQSNHFTKGASTCSGDSGGPMTQSTSDYKFMTVIGLTSYGINQNDLFGNCYLGGDGSFAHVDLQSPTSRSFLSFFPGIKYQNGYFMYVYEVASYGIYNLNLVQKMKSKPVILKSISKINKVLKTGLRYSDAKRKKLLNSASYNLSLAFKARSIKSTKTYLKIASSSLRKLKALEVS